MSPSKPKKKTIWTTAKADKIFSRWIRERDPYCFFMRKGCNNKSSQNSHFWGRGNSATRYDPQNCDGICGGCHMRHESNKQGLYRDFKIRDLGKEGYDLLEKRARSIVKRSDAILECMELLKEYQ